MNVFLVSMIGQVLAHRILSNIALDFAFPAQLLNFSRLISLFFIAFFVTVSGSVCELWLFIGILLITLKFFPLLLRYFLEKRLRTQFIPLLDAVILGLQMGKSFRAALKCSVDKQDGWMHFQLLEIYESLISSEKSVAMKSSLLEDLRLELIEIDRSKNRCVDQVKALRKDLKMREDFRRRSGQVTQQLKMQAIIVTALFLALLVFVIRQFGFREQLNLIFLSTSVFTMGLISIFLIGRRFKWKV